MSNYGKVIMGSFPIEQQNFDKLKKNQAQSSPSQELPVQS